MSLLPGNVKGNVTMAYYLVEVIEDDADCVVKHEISTALKRYPSQSFVLGEIRRVVLVEDTITTIRDGE